MAKRKKNIASTAQAAPKTQGKEKKKKQKKSRGEVAVQDLIPIKTIDYGVIQYENGSICKIVEVEPINFLLRSAQEKEEIIYGFASWLKISPNRIRIKSMTRRADINKHIEQLMKEQRQNPNPLGKEMVEAYVRLLREIGSKEALTRRFFVILEYGGDRRASLSEAAVELENDASVLSGYLGRCGNHIRQQQRPSYDTAEILYEWFNRRSCETESFQNRFDRIFEDKMKACNLRINIDPPVNVNPKDLIAPRGIDFNYKDYFIMDGTFYTYLYIKANGYPVEVPGGWVSALVNAGDGIEIDMQFEREDRSRIIESVSRQLRWNTVRMHERGGDVNATDYEEIAGALSSGHYIKSGITQNNEDFYWMQTFITISAKTIDELDYKQRAVINMLRTLDIECETMRWQMEDGLRTAIPGTFVNKSLSRKMKRNVLTSGAASTYMFTSFEMSDDNGILLGINRQNATLCIIDLFNTKKYTNANAIIIGKSGTGKTFAMQLLALRMNMRGIQSFIIAPFKGHEFRRAAYNVGGSYIKISPSSPHCINIMAIRPVSKLEEEWLENGAFDHRQDSYLTAKIGQIAAFMLLLHPGMTNIEENLLDEAIMETYAKFGITMDNNSIYVGEDENNGVLKTMPILGDLYNTLLGKEDCQRMATVLKPFVTGSSQNFNQQTNIDLDNNYIVLDISECKEKMLPIAMFITLDFVWSEVMANRMKKKAVFIDEVWKLIGASANKYAANFVLQIFKIIRGYGGSAIACTQDLRDFFSLDDGKFGAGIINNSNTKLLLSLETDESEYVKEAFKLSNSEIREIRGCERGEGLLIANNNKISIKVLASDYERDLITTDRSEMAAIAQRNKAEYIRRKTEGQSPIPQVKSAAKINNPNASSSRSNPSEQTEQKKQ